MPDQSNTAELIILADKTLGQIQGPLWGQFIEFMGRCINGGVYDPQSPHARADGTRADVFEALKELRPTHLRYPGGCATAYFDWQELTGPVQQRPRAKLFRGSNKPQSAAFGIPEAWQYAKDLGCEMYFCFNANTQSPEDAGNLVEYLNGTTHTKWADLRRAHGREEPYGVRLFGLGNEIYGDWQPGQKTADEYVKYCAEAIRQMKAVDSDIQIICCGLGRPGPEWDRKVLKGLISQIDMLSVHNYCGRPVFKDSMAAFRVYEQMFNAINVAIDEAMDSLLSRKNRPGLAFDEWNVWYRHRMMRAPVADVEEVYNFGDALTVATIFHVMLRNTKSITLSNISEVANVLGSLLTSPGACVKQSIWFPQKLMRDAHSGRTVDTVVLAPTFAAKHERYFCGIVDTEKAKDDTVPTLEHYTDIPALDVLTTIDDDAKRMSVSVVQKLEDRPLATRLTFRGIQPRSSKVKVTRLTGKSVDAFNHFDHPHDVGVASSMETITDQFTFPPASLTVLEFEL